MNVIKVVFFFLFLFSGFEAFCQIGISTTSPETSAELDIVSANKGLLIPRVELSTNLASPSPVSNPATGLLIYNSGINQEQGFYYWIGTTWKLIKSPLVGDISGPLSSTDNAIVRFDGASGKIIQNSPVLLSDFGSITGVANLTVDGFKMTSTPSLGHILVSDAFGNASWQSAPPIDVEEDNILIALNVNTLNFSQGVRVQDAGNEKATISFYANNVSNSLIQLSSSETTDLNNMLGGIAVPWNTIQQRDYGVFEHSTTNQPSRIKVLKHGIYEFNYMFATTSTTIQRKTLRSRLRKNGTDFIPNTSCYSFFYNIEDIRSSHVSSSFLVELEANDYIELVTNGQTNPGALTMIPYQNMFFIRLMRELESEK